MSDYVHPETLVDADWVAQHMADANIRLIDVDEDTSAYDKGHIRNAVGWSWFFDLHDPVRRDYVDQEGLSRLLQQAGVGPDTTAVLVGSDVVEVERGLLAGELSCPDCGGRLRPWGSARWRVVRRPRGVEHRRPRRARCAGCESTHVLISADSLLRRRDLAEVIGSALAAKAAGLGHRGAATMAGVPVSTVRGWLRRFAVNAGAIRVWFTVLAHDLDPMLAPLVPTATALGDAVEAIAVAARAASLRLAPVEPWSFASSASAGRLLSNTGWPWAPAG